MLLNSKRATVKEQQRINGGSKVITAIQLTEHVVKPSELGLRPGSFGVDWIPCGQGGYFQHKNAWEVVAA